MPDRMKTKSRQVTAGHHAVIEMLAARFGISSAEMMVLVVEVGIAAMERRLQENNHGSLPAMSKQQRVVYELLRQGKSVKEIAFQLQLGERSVRTHIARLRDKLNCSDLLDLRMHPGTPEQA
jgi:DNA-binding NarL/FixJ family response regulator